MRLLLVTNKNNHHKYWAFELYSRFNVVGIIHPHPTSNRVRLFNELKKSNILFIFLKILSFIYHKLSSKSFTKKLDKYQKSYFENNRNLYNTIPSNIIYDVTSINSDFSLSLAKKLQPDIICFLGGDIANQKFISLAKITALNYHSGISPFYNGSGTTFSAVADGRPNFCGGTLMNINERIDGGNILAHYLTPITDNDDSSKLFLKGIIGSVKLYICVIEYIIKNKIKPKGDTQQRTFRYIKSSEWTIYEDLKLNKFENSGKMKNYVRDEKILLNFDKRNNTSSFYFKTLSEILSK